MWQAVTDDRQLLHQEPERVPEGLFVDSLGIALGAAWEGDLARGAGVYFDLDHEQF
jgi:hypothetical protein